jgi:ATP-dependent RNA helicase DeaD
LKIDHSVPSTRLQLEPHPLNAYYISMEQEHFDGPPSSGNSRPAADGASANDQSGAPRRRRRRGGRNRGGNRQGGPGQFSQQGGSPQGGSHSDPQQPQQPQFDDDETVDIPAPRPGHAHHEGQQFAAEPHTPKILPPAFAALGLSPAILTALAEINFETPSEIQEKLIPFALAGRDVLGQARTGTGKTAAFGLPILQLLNFQQPFQAIIVVPTRELAVQVEAEMIRFARHTPARIQVVYGGNKVTGQIKLLGRNPHVIVGTPGRILDLYERGALPMNDMRFVVCDEVDRMFDIGFRDDIRRILSACQAPHQTMFVSATINEEIERMVRVHMRDPERIFTRKADEALTNPDAKQYVVTVQPWDKQRALKMLMRAEKPSLAIIFCRTKRSADKVAAGLTRDGVNAEPIHGDLVQNKRERVMRGFKTGKINVLVATDLASRGIDVHEISHVVNYDVPEDPEVYVHRIGRTARMGATGKAFTFVARGQGQMQTEIEKLTNHLMEEYRIDGFLATSEPAPREGYTGAPSMGGGRDNRGGGHGGGQGGNSGGAPSAPPKAQVEEGYQPTGFANVQATGKRPLGGKFPVKRRR